MNMARPDGTLGERETLIEIPAIEIAGKNLGRPDGTLLLQNAVGMTDFLAGHFNVWVK